MRGFALNLWAGLRRAPAASLPPPVADFMASDETTGDAPLDIDFVDLSTNTPTSWYWEVASALGEELDWIAFATDQNPRETFGPGQWHVRLTATNAGGSDTETKLVFVTAIAS